MQDSKKDSQDSKIVFRITRGIASALTAPTRDPVAEYVKEFCARSKECISQMHRTAVVSICQWIDASIATASAPSHVLYQGIPAAVIQGTLDGNSFKSMQRAASTSFKNVCLSHSDCLSVEAFLVALNMHAIHKHYNPTSLDDDVGADGGAFWKVPRSSSKSATIASICTWFKTSGQAILLCIDCFEKIPTNILSDIVTILWSVRHELPVVMLLMSQCDSEAIHEALSFSKSRFLLLNQSFRFPSPSEQLEYFFDTVLSADNALPILLDPRSVVILRNRFHQTERVVDSFVEGIIFTILLHSYHNPIVSTFFEFQVVKASCSQTSSLPNEEAKIGIRALHARLVDKDTIAEINSLASVSSSRVEITVNNIFHLFGYLCVRIVAYYAVPSLFRALLTPSSSRRSDIWGDTLVSVSSSPVWDGVQLGDGCENAAVENSSNIDRIRFTLWTCTPEVARKVLENFEQAVSRACAAIQAEDELIRKLVRELTSAECEKKKKVADNFLANVPVLLEALQLAQASMSSLAMFGEEGNWQAPFVAKSRDNCEPSSSAANVHKRRKLLVPSNFKAAFSSNRVNFRSRSPNFTHSTFFCLQISDIFHRCAAWETIAKTIDLLAFPLQKLPCHELLFSNSANHLSKFINVDNRGKMRQALENPKVWIAPSSAVPDTALAFQLMSSCPTRYIGLPDIMEAFLHDTAGDTAHAQLQAQFSRAISELQLMGFLKSTARRTDAAERSFFAPPGAAAFST